MAGSPSFTSVYLFVRELAPAMQFYERLGLTLESAVDDFARFVAANGMILEVGTAAVTRRYDPNFIEPDGRATNTLNFDLASPEAVDAKFEELTSAGYRTQVEPLDAFFRARFAAVLDPDGNVIGLHGPRDAPP